MRELSCGVGFVLCLVMLGCTSTTEGRMCGEPLSESELERVVFDQPIGGPMAVQAGTSRTMGLGLARADRPCCEVEPVDICATFSIDSAIPGVEIDLVSGELDVAPSVPNGTEFRIVADVEGGRRLVTLPVQVYVPNASAIVGTWTEVAQLECGSGADVAPEATMQELVFSDTGEFSATWDPFETYRDYWGRYDIDNDGNLQLVVEGGNYVPGDMDVAGRVEIDSDGSLVLSELWLGRYRDSVVFNCGHRFR